MRFGRDGELLGTAILNACWLLARHGKTNIAWCASTSRPAGARWPLQPPPDARGRGRGRARPPVRPSARPPGRQPGCPERVSRR